jgi:hypothetical protein
MTTDCRGSIRVTRMLWGLVGNPEATRQATLSAMGADPAGAGPPEQRAVYVLRPGQTMCLDRPAELKLDNGTVLQINTALPL